MVCVILLDQDHLREKNEQEAEVQVSVNVADGDLEAPRQDLDRKG